MDMKGDSGSFLLAELRRSLRRLGKELTVEVGDGIRDPVLRLAEGGAGRCATQSRQRGCANCMQDRCKSTGLGNLRMWRIERELQC